MSNIPYFDILHIKGELLHGPTPDGEYCKAEYAKRLEAGIKEFLDRREAIYLTPDNFYQSMMDMHRMLERLISTGELVIPKDIHGACYKLTQISDEIRQKKQEALEMSGSRTVASVEASELISALKQNTL